MRLAISLPRTFLFLAGDFYRRPRGVVETVLHCHCGFEARAVGEAELVAEVQRHALAAHGMRLTEHEALLLAFRAQLDGQASAAIPHMPTRPEKEET
jgi:hypothetical protein